MGYENIIKDSNFRQTSTGDYGFRLLSSAGTATSTSGESFRAIQVLESAEVTTTTSNGDALTAQSLPDGVTIFGKFDSITVVSGTVLAYLAS